MPRKPAKPPKPRPKSKASDIDRAAAAAAREDLVRLRAIHGREPTATEILARVRELHDDARGGRPAAIDRRTAQQRELDALMLTPRGLGPAPTVRLEGTRLVTPVMSRDQARAGAGTKATQEYDDVISKLREIADGDDEEEARKAKRMLDAIGEEPDGEDRAPDEEPPESRTQAQRDLDRQMGIPRAAAGPHLEGRRLVLPTMTPAESRAYSKRRKPNR
jgi:hypothetical protein